MRRLPILLVFALMFALLVLAPASADPPKCAIDNTLPGCSTDDSTTTTTTTVPGGSDECIFVDGVLQGWEPPDYLRCRWSVPPEERDKTFHFSLELVPEVEGATVNLPHLIVTDVFPYGGQICFNEYVNGWNNLPYSWSPFNLPDDGLCTGGGGSAVDNAKDVFAITIDVIKVKKGAVQLTYFTTEG